MTGGEKIVAFVLNFVGGLSHVDNYNRSISVGFLVPRWTQKLKQLTAVGKNQDRKTKLFPILALAAIFSNMWFVG